MASFVFEAKSMTGKSLKGEIEASNEAEARVKLRAQKLIPVKVTSKEERAALSKSYGVKKVKAKDLQILTRQFSTLLGAGIPVVQSLEVLAKGSKNVSLANTLQEVVNLIGSGKRLGDALAQYPLVFDTFYVNMVKAGEEGGVLDIVLDRLAEYIEKNVKLTGKIKGAMIYPAAIIVVAFLVIAAIMIFVIPNFEELFASMNQELPALTQYVVDASRFFVSYWYIIFGGAGFAIFLLRNYYRTPDGKNTVDAILIDVPLIGDVIQKGAIAKFSRTLSTLVAAGVGIMESMDIAARVAGNIVLEQAFFRAKDAISQGKSMTVPLSKEKYVPSMVTQMVGVGEQTGALDTMLSKIADFYEDEVDASVGALTAAMEPLLMVVLGGIIAVLVIAMYLPIFNMAGAMAGG